MRMHFAQTDLGFLMLLLLKMCCAAYWSDFWRVSLGLLCSQNTSSTCQIILGCSWNGDGTTWPTTHIGNSSWTVLHLNFCFVRNQGWILCRNGSDHWLMYNAVSINFRRAALLSNNELFYIKCKASFQSCLLFYCLCIGSAVVNILK